MIEINLVPDVKQELIRAQRIRSAVITVSILIALVSVGVVVLLSVYIFLIQNVRNSLADQSITKENAKLQSVKDLSKTLTIQNQLTKIGDLNSQKVIGSRLFDFLGAVIPAAPNEVAISTLSMDATANTIILQAQAANGFVAAETFKKTLDGAQLTYKDSDGSSQTADIASDISLSNTSYGLDSTGTLVLRFTISFTYDKALFAPDISDIGFKNANTGVVTDSYLGIPVSIFAAPATDIKGDK